jgi:hypothetical protein
MTIGELKERLKNWPDDDTIIFGCEELEFYRLKRRGDYLVQLEFSQNIWKDSATGAWHVDDSNGPAAT